MKQCARSKWLEQCNVVFDFHAYFWSLYGSRWKDLFASLDDLHKVVGFCNPFVQRSKIEKQGLAEYLGTESLGQLSGLKIAVGVTRHDKILTSPVTNLKPYYWIDAASFVPPLFLDVDQSHRVLDMCAAPGGKSLIIASLMFGDYSKKIQFRSKKFQQNLQPENSSISQQNDLKLDGSLEICNTQFNSDVEGGCIEGLRLNNDNEFSIHQNLVQQQHVVSCQKKIFSIYNEQQISKLDVENVQNQKHISLLGNKNVTSEKNDQISDDVSEIDINQQQLGHLVCNEIDGLRSSRLERILCENLPYYGCLDKFISIGRKDGGRYWSNFEQESFDRVLVDAPCTSERHVAQRAARERWGSIAHDHWSLEMCRNHRKLQETLLYAGIRCLKQGGRLVYSTCSLDKAQNDGVVQTVIKKIGKQHLRVVITDNKLAKAFSAEFTNFGIQIYPDESGFGPLYICVLQKI